jgi:hypothetical protein
MMRWFVRRTAITDEAEVAPTGCPVCQADPVTMPHVARPCSHVFCYYCLAGSRLGELRFRCPTCDEVVTSAERVQRPSA